MPPELALALGSADWSLVAWLALLAGCLALDETALAQTWLSQPLPAAILAGLVCGEPMAGLAVGLPLQLALTMNLPVGQTVTGDAAGAAVAAVGGAVVAGRLPAALAGGAGDPALTGWLLLGAALISLTGHPLIQAERRLHLVWMLQGGRTLRDGRLGRIVRIQGLCVLATFVRGALFGAAATLVVAGVWIPAYDALPPSLSPALAWLPWLAGALGLGAVFERYGLSRKWRWVAAGAAAGWLLGVVA
jgi:mannose/fructose/N-acetylgalactosamine-specific phosphotransferase system component IIC